MASRCERIADVVAIGAGQAAVPLVRALAEQGQQVALVEREELGGSCINFGCTPTKAALASARQVALMRRRDLGVAASGIEVDFREVMTRAADLAAGGREHLNGLFADADNPCLIRGHARLWGRDGDRFRVVVDDGPVILARHVVLDTRSRSSLPAIPGIERVATITAENWLDLDSLPERLLVIGSGAVGLEMAQFYRRMGAAVTLVERSREISPMEDEDVARVLRQALTSEDIDFRLDADVEKIEQAGNRLIATIDGAGADFSHVFVATGRLPSLADLGLDSVGLSPEPGGALWVDERLRTRVPGLFAAGDVRGGLAFTHTAWDDYRILLSVLGDGPAHTTRRVVPYATFTEPELARVGASEKELGASGVAHHVHRSPYSSIAKAREDGRATGTIKLIVDEKRERLLGAAILGEAASELIHLLALVMRLDQPLSAIVAGIYAHPTLAEGLQSAVTAATKDDA